MAAHPQLDAYLRVLAGAAPRSSFIELRHRVAPHTLAAEFLPAHDRQALSAAIERRARMTDVYVGCAPRARRSGKKRDIAEVWVLWAECDGAAAAQAAQAYDPEPAIVIASGSGPNVHAYWPLRESLPPQEAERANLRLAHALGADRVCYDAARILRPPATWNHKRQPPNPVVAKRPPCALPRSLTERSIPDLTAWALRADSSCDRSPSKAARRRSSRPLLTVHSSTPLGDH